MFLDVDTYFLSIFFVSFQSGPHPASLIALQQIADLVLPHSRFNQTSLAGGRGGGGISGEYGGYGDIGHQLTLCRNISAYFNGCILIVIMYVCNSFAQINLST